MSSVRRSASNDQPFESTGVGVLDKATAVLRAVEAAPLDLAGLQAATGLPRATAHRLATALEAHGLVRRDAQGRFCLGFELVRLGRSAARSVLTRFQVSQNWQGNVRVTPTAVSCSEGILNH